jgi:hypothetical protein
LRSGVSQCTSGARRRIDAVEVAVLRGFDEGGEERLGDFQIVR